MRESAGAIILSALVSLAFGGWVLMLLLGMFAGYMAMPGLAIGYWASLGIFVLGRLAFVRASSS